MGSACVEAALGVGVACCARRAQPGTFPQHCEGWKRRSWCAYTGTRSVYGPGRQDLFSMKPGLFTQLPRFAHPAHCSSVSRHLLPPTLHWLQENGQSTLSDSAFFFSHSPSSAHLGQLGSLSEQNPQLETCAHADSRSASNNKYGGDMLVVTLRGFRHARNIHSLETICPR